MPHILFCFMTNIVYTSKPVVANFKDINKISLMRLFGTAALVSTHGILFRNMQFSRFLECTLIMITTARATTTTVTVIIIKNRFIITFQLNS